MNLFIKNIVFNRYRMMIKSGLFTLRAKLVKAIASLYSSGADLQDIIMSYTGAVRYLFLILLLVPGTTTIARAVTNQHYRDSLTNIYNSHYAVNVTDTAGIRILIQISNDYVTDSPGKAYTMAQQVAAYSVRAHWKLGIYYAMFISGNCFIMTDGWNEALTYCRSAQMTAHSMGRKDLEVVALCRISNIYERLQIMDSALYYKREVFGLRVYLANSTTKSYFLNDFAADYMNLKKYDSAILLSKEAIQIASLDKKTTGDVLGMFWNILGCRYNSIHLYDSARYCIEQGIKAAHAGKDSGKLTNLLFSLAEYYMNTGKPGKAIFYARRSVDLSAPEYGERFLIGLSDMYKQIGKYDSALFYYKQYIIYHNKYLSWDKTAERSKEMTKTLFTEQINSFKTRQEFKDKKQAADRRMLGIVTFIALILILLAIIFARSSQRHKMKNKTISLLANELAEKNSAIQASLNEKETLLKEIHHRVKNNLQVVSSLLNLQLSGISNPLVQQAIIVSKSRIKAISLIHKQLYQNDNLISIDFYDFSNKLFSQVAALYRFEHVPPIFKNQSPHVLLHADTAVIISLILNELFTNSFKHAFDKVADPEISISLEIAGTPTYRLSYSDNGPGLPPGFNAATTDTLGIKLIRSLSGQLKGDFNYDSNSCMFIILFKVDIFNGNNYY